VNRFRTKPECGTKSGYDYHVRQVKEAPCQECSNALKTHWQKQRKIRSQEINAYRQAWRTMHPEIQKARQNIQARKHGKGDWTTAEALEIYGTDCHICGTAIDLKAPTKVGADGWELALHLDHVIPLSKGGADTLGNIRPAHAKCNIRKWATVKLEELNEQ
jgi:5-methylcytosine-specific restriction endonuclease McrA